MSQDFYYKSLTKHPAFNIMLNNIDGGIPSCYVDSWQEFQSILNDDFFNSDDKELIYRGQEDFKWGLFPSLGRLNNAGTIDEKLAQKHLDLFKLSIRGRGFDSNMLDDDIELWALGQHNGLKTPLLDWTYSPYISLFFAFEKNDSLETNEESRAIFVLNKKALEELDENIFIQPRRNDHVRLVNQAGLFTMSPSDSSDTLESHILKLIGEVGINLDDAKEVAYYICKIHIPNIQKTECLSHLRKMNIHHASLFPDIIGSSLYCNEITYENAQPKQPLEIKEPQEIKEPVIEHISEVKNIDVVKYGTFNKDLIYAYFKSVANITTKLPDDEVLKISYLLTSRLSPYITIDWINRENSIAKLKNVTRMILLKYSFDGDELREIIDNFIDNLIHIEKTKELGGKNDY